MAGVNHTCDIGSYYLLVILNLGLITWYQQFLIYRLEFASERVGNHIFC